MFSKDKIEQRIVWLVILCGCVSSWYGIYKLVMWILK